MDTNARITKSIRLDPNLDKKINKFCKLENTTQANYINKILNEDLKTRTLERTERQEKIIFQLPKSKEDIKQCIKNKTDLRYYDNAPVFTVTSKINNYLDIWNNGTYKTPFFNFLNHSGLILLTEDINLYFVYLEYEIKDQYIKDSTPYSLYDNKEYDYILKDIENKKSVRIESIYLITEERARAYIDISKNTELSEMFEKFTDKSVNNTKLVKSIDLKNKDNQNNNIGIFSSTLAEKSKENKELKAENEILKKENKELNENIEKIENKLCKLQIENETLKNDINEQIKQEVTKVIDNLKKKIGD